MEMDSILEGLCDSVKDKVGKCVSYKEFLDKIHNFYSKKSPLENVDHDKKDEEYV
jgi:hypothetical protein